MKLHLRSAKIMLWDFFSPKFTEPVLRIPHLNVWEVVSYTPMYLEEKKNLDARISSRVLDTKIERCLQSTVYNVCMQFLG